MELGFVENLRRRWDGLGVHEKDTVAEAKDKALLINDFEGQDDVMPIENDESRPDEGDEARKEILKGAIVKSVISSAAQGELPSIALVMNVR